MWPYNGWGGCGHVAYKRVWPYNGWWWVWSCSMQEWVWLYNYEGGCGPTAYKSGCGHAMHEGGCGPVLYKGGRGPTAYKSLMLLVIRMAPRVPVTNESRKVGTFLTTTLIPCWDTVFLWPSLPPPHTHTHTLCRWRTLTPTSQVAGSSYHATVTSASTTGTPTSPRLTQHPTTRSVDHCIWFHQILFHSTGLIPRSCSIFGLIPPDPLPFHGFDSTRSCSIPWVWFHKILLHFHGFDSTRSYFISWVWFPNSIPFMGLSIQLFSSVLT